MVETPPGDARNVRFAQKSVIALFRVIALRKPTAKVDSPFEFQFMPPFIALKIKIALKYGWQYNIIAIYNTIFIYTEVP